MTRAALKDLKVGDRFRFDGEEQVWIVNDLDYGNGAVKVQLESEIPLHRQISTVKSSEVVTLVEE